MGGCELKAQERSRNIPGQISLEVSKQSIKLTVTNCKASGEGKYECSGEKRVPQPGTSRDGAGLGPPSATRCGREGDVGKERSSRADNQGCTGAQPGPGYCPAGGPGCGGSSSPVRGRHHLDGRVETVDFTSCSLQLSC